MQRSMYLYIVLIISVSYCEAVSSIHSSNRDCKSSEESTVCIFGIGQVAGSSYWLQTDIRLTQSKDHVTTCFHVFFKGVLAESTSRTGLFAFNDEIFLLLDYDYKIILERNERKIYSTTTIPLYQWTHICATYGTSMELIIDGVKTTQTSLSSDNSESVKPGKKNIILGTGHKCDDDVLGHNNIFYTVPQIITRKLTDNEIESLSTCSISNILPEDAPYTSLTEWEIVGEDTPETIEFDLKQNTERFTVERSCLDSVTTDKTTNTVEISSSSNSVDNVTNQSGDTSKTTATSSVVDDKDPGKDTPEMNSVDFTKHSANECLMRDFFGPYSIEIEELEVSKVCIPLEKTFIYRISIPTTYNESVSTCSKLKGRIISIEDDTIEEKLNAFVLDNQIETTTGFLRRDNDTCYNLYVVQHMVETKESNCTDTETMNSTFCEVTESLSLNMRLYNIEDHVKSTPRVFTNDQTMHLVHDLYDGIVMASYSGYLIKSISLTTYQLSIPSGYTFTTGQDVGLPLGMHAWQIYELPSTITDMSISSYTQSHNIIISACNPDQFTCFTGECVALTLRCDGNLDCTDESDEICNILISNYTSSSSQVQMPPMAKTPIELEIQLVRVQSVEVDSNIARIRIKLLTLWKDSRLYFSQLQSNWGDNNLPSTVWAPRYNFTNILFEDLRSYFQGSLATSYTFARKEISVDPTISDITGMEGYLVVSVNQTNFTKTKDIFLWLQEYQYSASTESSLLRVEELVAGFICNFELTLFPFDVHECKINMSTINKGSFTTYFKIKDIRRISEAMTLTLFQISKLHFEQKNYDGNDIPTSISFSVILERRYASFYLTTILPCVLIGFIGTCSHWFALDDFSNRIMVTLSCLIVLASLFAQLSSTLPESPSPKAIEIFFFFYIAKLSYVYICHTIIGFVMRRRERNKHTIQVFSNKVENYPGIPKAFPYQIPKTYKISAETLDNVSVSLGLIIEGVFLGLFFGHIFYERNLILSIIE